MAPAKKSKEKDAHKEKDLLAAGSGGGGGGKRDGDADSETNEPVSSFQSLFAEGDILAKQGDYRKAIEAYTKALGMRQADKNCLVARSKCYLQLGDSQAALEDANLALKEDQEYFKGVFQKAEALYSKGDFEMALVFYHRGNKLRPELDEFRLGIQKAREAIDNSIGNPKDYKFQAPQGIKFTPQGLGVVAGGPSAPLAKGVVAIVPSALKKDGSNSGKNVKQLLGELYADKEYLEQLLNDRDFINNPNDGIASLVSDALNYLETRTEFWRQQRPIYARRKEHSKIIVKAISARNRALIAEKARDHKDREAALAAERDNPKAYGATRTRSKSAEQVENNKFTLETTKYVNASMNVVTRSIEKGDYQRALHAAKSLMIRLPDIKHLPNREKVLSDVTSVIGNIYMDMGSLPQAMQFFRKDLNHCRAKTLTDCLSRAQGNVGRICVKLHRFDEAIATFQEKLDAAGPTAGLERAWLLHDIGRCHLEMGRDAAARQFGETALGCAEAVKDWRWCLNACVLLGQAEVRSKKHVEAWTAYSKALAYAKELEDPRGIEAITEALGQLKVHLANPPPPSSILLPSKLSRPKSAAPASSLVPTNAAPLGTSQQAPAAKSPAPPASQASTKFPPVASNSVVTNHSIGHQSSNGTLVNNSKLAPSR